MAEIKFTKHTVDFDPFADGEIQRTAPLTEAQKEVWASVQMGDEANCAYNESMSLAIRGDFQHEIFQQAIHDLIEKHDAFRMTFSPDGMLLTVTDTLSIGVPLLDLSHKNTISREKKLQELLIKDASTPFSLEHGPLIRASVIKLEDTEYRVILTAHHIVCDGWSMAVAIRDLGQFYSARNQGYHLASSPEYLFTDYAIEDNEHLNSAEGHEAKQFWLSHFSGEIPVMDIPTDHSRPPVRTFEAHRVDQQLSPELIQNLKKTGAQAGATFITILLAGFKAYLYRITGQDDIIVGTPTAGQSATGKETLVGHCVNLLPLRSQIRPGQTFFDYLKVIRSLMLDAFEYQRYTFVSLIKEIQLPRDPSRIPLVPIIFNMDQQSNDDGFSVENLQADIFSNHRTFENFEIFLNISSSNNKVVFECTYNSNLFDQETIRLRLAEYVTFLTALTVNPNQFITELPILPKEEKHKLLTDWNATALEYPKHLRLHQLFETQAARYSERIAAEFSDTGLQLTYKELNEKANQLANHLINNRVTAGGMIGICIERSLDMLIGLLAILKTGNAYVPLDPEYPQSRLNYMIENAELTTLVTQKTLQSIFTSQTEVNICLDTDSTIIAALPTTPPVLQYSSPPSEDIAYVIYTSGSTGTPKGVKVPHQAVVNFLAAMADRPGITKDDILLAVTTLSFDIAGLELFLPITTGAKVVIATKEEATDAALLDALLSNSRATIMQATPATWHMLINNGWIGTPSLKILCGGEAMPGDLMKELLTKGTQLWNMYGPTETTIWSTCFQVTRAHQDVLIGRPIGNTTTYVLDNTMQPVPIGIPGELYIGGDGVSKGYLKREELTARQFVSNPFSHDTTGPLYKTGDLVRFKHDGNIEYLRRIDKQVKVRGFRIELGEIEAALENFPSITRGVVIVKDYDRGDIRLIAYYTVSENTVISRKKIKDHLRTMLPDYMIPQHFVQLKDFPLTPAGKIDRKALPLPGDTHRQEKNTFTPAQTDNEQTLVTIWQNILSVEHIGITDNFFDLGGHSLLATQAVAQLRKNGFQINLRQFFEFPTIQAMAKVLDKQTGPNEKLATITPHGFHTSAPLSLQQQRLWYLDKLDSDTTAYNLPGARRITGPLNIPLLESCINSIFKRHDILRTSIQDTDQQGMQVISPDLHFTLPVEDLSTLPLDKQEKALKENLVKAIQTPFKLTEAPLFRAKIITMGEEDHVFFFMPHHVVWDGWSFDVFHYELNVLYQAGLAEVKADLPELPVQYSDFAKWQMDWLKTGEIERQLTYWHKKLGGDLPILELCLDRPRPAVMRYNHASTIHFHLTRDTCDRLTKIAHSQEATFFMLLLAAFNILLYRYTSGQKDIIVGAPISGRNHAETAHLIGFFVNTLVLRNQLNPDEKFSSLLNQVKVTCIDGFSHQETPFEKLIETLNPVRDTSRPPLFQVLFTYQDVRNRKTTLAELDYKQLKLDRQGTQTELDYWVRLSDTGIAGGFDYNTDLFEEKTIQRMVHHYEDILHNIINHSDDTIKNLSTLPSDEYKKIVHDWNQTRQPFPNTVTVQQLFTEQAAQNPKASAIRFQDQSYSYKELNERSNQWAHKLIELGVKENSLVGICLDRSPDMIVCLLGILKAGAAYLPLDPDYPAERLNYMAEDSELDIVLTQRNLQDKIPDSIQTKLFIDESEPSTCSIENTLVKISPENLAYIIYTSGSTGKPKGVQVPHQALTNFLLSMQQEPGIKATDTLLAVTTLSFDIAGLELFLPLITGATCEIADRETTIDGHKLSQLLSNSETSIMQATPSTWRLLIAAGWQGQENLKILCGGEAFPQDLVQQLLDRCSELWNMYGPTETTIWSTCRKITDAASPISIGRPIANTRVYILDAQMHPVPVGVPGELYIGGTGVTRGYLNREELTQRQFLTDPFIQTNADQESALMYKTGDRVRFQPDGSIEYLERIDNQVKVRGFRIELGEIEACLAAHTEVAQAVAVCREDRPGDKRLYAYILARSAGNLDTAELRQHVRKTLPEYMVPQHFIEIASIPLTPAGKVDRRSLPAPEDLGQIHQDTYVSPATDTEKTVADIWQEVISLARIGIHDNFFDIGGHSLLAVELFATIKKKFGLELPLALLFKAPTIHELADRIDAELYLAETKTTQNTPEDDEREEFEF